VRNILICVMLALLIAGCSYKSPVVLGTQKASVVYSNITGEQLAANFNRYIDTPVVVKATFKKFDKRSPDKHMALIELESSFDSIYLWAPLDLSGVDLLMVKGKNHPIEAYGLPMMLSITGLQKPLKVVKVSGK